MANRLQLVLYRTLSRRLRGLEPLLGTGMQSVAWGLFGPMLHPELFRGYSVQSYLRQAFLTVAEGKPVNQGVQQALWLLKRLDHVAHVLAAGPTHIDPPPDPRAGIHVEAQPLLNLYRQPTEALYIDPQLRAARYPMLLGDLFSAFPGQAELTTTSTCVTEGVEISAKGVYVGSISTNVGINHRFQYDIKIKNTSTDYIQLLSRHWYFYNPDTKVMESEVVGAGVVGTSPSLSPGASYSYTSGTSSMGTRLVMKGTFQFVRKTAPGETENFDVYVAPLRLEADPP